MTDRRARRRHALAMARHYADLANHVERASGRYAVDPDEYVRSQAAVLLERASVARATGRRWASVARRLTV